MFFELRKLIAERFCRVGAAEKMYFTLISVSKVEIAMKWI